MNNEGIFYGVIGFIYLSIYIWGVRQIRLKTLKISSLFFKVLFWSNPILIICGWGLICSFGWVDPLWLPSPINTGKAFVKLIFSGKLPEAAWTSFIRILVGFSASALLGTLLGILAGTFMIARTLVIPVTSFLRYIPPTAFIALVVIYFGIDEAYKYMVIFMGTIFFNISMVFDAIEDMDRRYVEMARVAGFNTWHILWRIILPYAGPRIIDILRINLSGAWTFLIAAEIIGASGGLGHLIALSQRFLRVDELYATIITFGIIGLTTDVLIERLGRCGFRWHSLSLAKR